MRNKIVSALALVTLISVSACATVNKHVSKGFDAYTKLDYVTAEKEFTKALEDDKDDPYANLNMGALYQATGRPQLAVPLYMKAIEKGKNIRPNRKANNKDASPTIAEIAQKNLDVMVAGNMIKK